MQKNQCSRIPDAMMRELMDVCLRNQRERSSLAAIEMMDRDTLRWAYELALVTLREKCGYELGQRNRSSSPSKWSADFRIQVLAAADAIEEYKKESR